MSDNTNEIILEVKDLKKSFGDHVVLESINTTVRKGEVIAIIGPSGCGKSTFLRSLNLLETPTEGHVLFHEQDLTDKSVNVDELREKIGMVFQHFNLFPNMTIRRNITLAPTKLGLMSKEEADKKADELLARVGLSDKADAYPNQLSGGQKQRVAIARALAMNPEIMLFDEPTSALDPQGRAEVMSIIKNLADMGTTIILCTHILSDVERTANRIGIVRDGRMAVEGTIAEIKEQYDKAGKKIVMGIFGDPSAAIQPVSTLTGGNFYFDRQRAVFEIPIASDINEQETAHRLFDLLNSAGLTVSLFVIENKTLEQIYMETIG